MEQCVRTGSEKVSIPLWRHGRGVIIEGVEQLDKLSSEVVVPESPQDECGANTDSD